MIVSIHVIPPQIAQMEMWRKFTNKTVKEDL